jgi:biotin transport system substrate-specific component
MQTALISKPAFKSVGYSFLFASLTAFAAWVEVPMFPVPMTMQTCAVLLSGALLGAQRGMISQLIYLFAGLFLPIYAGGATGYATLFGATGGYLLSFPIAAFLVGAALNKVSIETSLANLFARIFAVSFVILILGSMWLQIALNLSIAEAVAAGFAPFIIGDAVKCGIVAAVVKAENWISTHKPNLF